MQRVDVLGIGERELAGEVLVAGEEGGQGVAAVVGRKHHVHDGLRERLDVADDARTALVQHEDDRLAGSSKFPDEFLLVLGEVQVVHVAGRLAVRVLAHASDDHIRQTGGPYDGIHQKNG